MAEQAELDGIRSWGGQLLNAFGSQLANNVTGNTAEKVPDQVNTEEVQGKPTPGQAMAGRMQNIVGNNGVMFVVGGTILLVAAVAIMGARK